jgi:hypothetical protein
MTERTKIVNLVKGVTPADYHCTCQYCAQVTRLRSADPPHPFFFLESPRRPLPAGERAQ